MCVVENYETILAPDQAEPFLKQIKKFTCSCGADLKDQPIIAYPHGAGWKVKDLDSLQWLYIVCPKCHYQWALWKLGVSRGVR